MRVRHWRGAAQAAAAAMFVMPPLLRIDGRPLALFDLPGLRLFLAGRVFTIADTGLAALAAGAFILAFLLAAVVLGRAWCGWACPQTWFLDAGDFIGGRAGNAAARHLAFIVMAAACGFVFTAWFIDARELAARLRRLAPGPWPGWTMAAVTAAAWLDLAVVKRGFCRDLCPYGRIQASLAVPATLLVGIPAAEMKRCIDCKSCVRSCPMGIDIREGPQVACISCGECIDACRKAMARRDGGPLPAWRFGDMRARDAILTPRTLVTAALLAACLAALVRLAGRPPGADLSIRRLAGIRPRLTADGDLSSFFDARIRNRGGRARSFRLAVSGPGARLAGQTRTGPLPPGGETVLRFVLVTRPRAGVEARVALTDGNGEELAAARLVVPKTTSPR